MSMNGSYLALPQEQLDRLIANPDALTVYQFNEHQDDVFDVDKTWHGIHYLLTGSDWGGDEPWWSIVMGGTEFSPELGYGQARYLLPTEVHDFAEAMNGVSRDELASRYSPTEMDQAGIYPEISE